MGGWYLGVHAKLPVNGLRWADGMRAARAWDVLGLSGWVTKFDLPRGHGDSHLVNIHSASAGLTSRTVMTLTMSNSPFTAPRTQAPPGTRIEIRGLKTPVDEAATRKLARELILLSDPFGDPCGFKPILVAPEFKALEELVDRDYFDDAELQLVADLDAKGQASAKVLDRSGNVRWRSSVEGFKNAYRAPAARFEVWVFLIQQSSFEGRAATVGEVRKWLKEVGGIHLYHRGLRVRPYGDPGHDWLDMNLSRSRDPALRPSTNTAIGPPHGSG